MISRHYNIQLGYTMIRNIKWIKQTDQDYIRYVTGVPKKEDRENAEVIFKKMMVFKKITDQKHCISYLLLYNKNDLRRKV